MKSKKYKIFIYIKTLERYKNANLTLSQKRKLDKIYN